MLLEIRNLSRSYGGIKAIEDISLSVERGSITALTGENGAGKSTLIKCITGAETPDSGEIIFDGRILPYGDTHAIRLCGIETVYQHLNLCPGLDAVQNIFLGREKKRCGFFLDHKTMQAEAVKLLQEVNASVPPNLPVGRLSGGQQQAVAIARALLFRPRLLILDEPTAALDKGSIRQFLAMVNELKKAGIAILLVSHRADEMEQVADRILAIQLGKIVNNPS